MGNLRDLLKVANEYYRIPIGEEQYGYEDPLLSNDERFQITRDNIRKNY